ncbi:TPA: hypothetical protein I7288_06600 [Vibrio parahaemolyticus]|uniref:CDP-glycerol glycerophosphotransferase family protein n=1 Tax=Vibrio parahaemolyticus TaxID=670 RepID=UPI00084ACC6C|nr:CDP-glycerol glycerophosphotransferase family protein [Vibrio parahaemolyticus]ODX67266.1 hypothetical protein BBM09_05540 [Vibrio parahaemolyticus]HAS6884413.1 hypothetical protein [Vibrio parahaemolyticus]
MLKKIIKILYKLTLWRVTSLIPKKENLIIVGAWYGKQYKDNSKAVFLKLIESSSHETYWITKDRDLAKKIPKGLYYHSIKGIIVQIRAGIILYSMSVEDDFSSTLIPRNRCFINLWHGMPIKKIGIDKGDNDFGHKTKLMKLWYEFSFKYLSYRPTFMLANSFWDKKIYQSAFNLPSSNVIELGLPRNDYIDMDDLNSCKGKILFAPTFRENTCDISYFDAKDLSMINRVCLSKNYSFFIRLHPSVDLDSNLLSEINNFDAISFSTEKEVNINDYELLITDFSGMVFDFIYCSKPIAFIDIDYDGYILNERELYVDVKDKFSRHFYDDWLKLFEYITKNELQTMNSCLYFKDFHYYSDGLSSKRVVDFIESIND